MFTDFPTHYYNHVVLPFCDYRKVRGDGSAGHQRDLRTAISVATVLYHLREHLPPTATINARQIGQICPDYGLLGDVVNASKHHTLTRPTSHGAPLVSDATQLSEYILITMYKDSDGDYRYFEKVTAVTLVDGSERDLLEVMTNVINFWENHLHQTGILPEARLFKIPTANQPRTREECVGHSQPELVGTVGVALRHSMRIQAYNYSTGQVEPYDFTGATIRAQIRSPKYHFDFAVVEDASGREVKGSVELSRDESVTLALLETESARQAYATSLPSVKQALAEAARAVKRRETAPPQQVPPSDEKDD